MSLWETDEPIYSEVAKEILKPGDWVTLHFNYRAWFDKPPLYMWLTALWYHFLAGMSLPPEYHLLYKVHHLPLSSSQKSPFYQHSRLQIDDIPRGEQGF